MTIDFQQLLTRIGSLENEVKSLHEEIEQLKAPQAPEWIAPQQAAEILNVSPQSIYRWIKQGSIQRHFSPDGSSYRLKRSEVEQFYAAKIDRKKLGYL